MQVVRLQSIDVRKQAIRRSLRSSPRSRKLVARALYNQHDASIAAFFPSTEDDILVFLWSVTFRKGSKRFTPVLDLLDRSTELRARAARSSALRENRMWNKPDPFSTVMLCAPTCAHRLVINRLTVCCMDTLSNRALYNQALCSRASSAGYSSAWMQCSREMQQKLVCDE